MQTRASDLVRRPRSRRHAGTRHPETPRLARRSSRWVGRSCGDYCRSPGWGVAFGVSRGDGRLTRSSGVRCGCLSMEGGMASKLKIKVNGLVHSVTASLDTPLRYV